MMAGSGAPPHPERFLLAPMPRASFRWPSHRGRPGDLLGRSAPPRDPAARRLPHLALAGAALRRGGYEVTLEPRLRRGRGRLRRPARDLDQHEIARLYTECTSWATPIRIEIWMERRAGGRGLRRDARRGVLRRKHVLAPHRRLQDGAGLSHPPPVALRVRAVRHAVHHPASRQPRRDRDFTRPLPRACTTRSRSRRRSPRCRWTPTLSRCGAAQDPDVVARMLQRVERRRRGDHPAREELLAAVAVAIVR